MTSQQPPNLFLSKQKKDPATFDFLPKIINGAIAGIIGTALMYPLDLAKTRIQNQVVSSNGAMMYTSMADCLRKTVKYEGRAGLYRGVRVASILIAPEKAIKLTANDFIRYLLKRPEQHHLSLPREIISAAGAGFLQNIFTTPMDLIKIQMQDAGRIAAINKAHMKYDSAVSIAMAQIKRRGIIGLYRGVGPTTFRNVLFSVVYFPVFYQINYLGPRKSSNAKESASYWLFISGCVAGSIAAFLATPFDVVKTRMQRIVGGKGDTQYSGTVDAFVKIFRAEGPMALMKGAGIRMLVIAPLFGIFQTVYFLGVGEHLVGSVRRSKP